MKLKKLLSLFLAFAMLMSISSTAFAAEIAGRSKATAFVDENGVLVVQAGGKEIRVEITETKSEYVLTQTIDGVFDRTERVKYEDLGHEPMCADLSVPLKAAAALPLIGTYQFKAGFSSDAFDTDVTLRAYGSYSLLEESTTYRPTGWYDVAGWVNKIVAGLGIISAVVGGNIVAALINGGWLVIDTLINKFGVANEFGLAAKKYGGSTRLDLDAYYDGVYQSFYSRDGTKEGAMYLITMTESRKFEERYYEGWYLDTEVQTRAELAYTAMNYISPYTAWELLN